MSWQMCVAALVLSAATFGQSDITDPKLIAYAKGLDVSRLDPTLPKQPLEKWFSAQGIAEDKLVWRRSDCDLMPSFDKPREPRPLCVAFVITVASDAGVVGKIFVGSDQKGIDGPPKFGGIFLAKGPPTAPQYESAEKLSELPRLIAQARSAAKWAVSPAFAG